MLVHDDAEMELVKIAVGKDSVNRALPLPARCAEPVRRYVVPGVTPNDC